MKKLIEKIRQNIYEWAQHHKTLELSEVEVYPSGVPDVIHVIVVASKGFEKWDQSDREDDLYRFLRKKLGDADIVKISLLLTLTEEQNEKYERAPVD